MEPAEYVVWVVPGRHVQPIEGVDYDAVPTEPLQADPPKSPDLRWAWVVERQRGERGRVRLVVHLYDCPRAPHGGVELNLGQALTELERPGRRPARSAARLRRCCRCSAPSPSPATHRRRGRGAASPSGILECGAAGTPRYTWSSSPSPWAADQRYTSAHQPRRFASRAGPLLIVALMLDNGVHESDRPLRPLSETDPEIWCGPGRAAVRDVPGPGPRRTAVAAACMSRLGAYELMTRIAAHHGWTIEPEEMEPERVVLLLRVVQCWIGVSTATAEHNLAYLVAGRIEDDGNVTPPVVEGVARCDQVDSVLDAADDLMRHLVANSRAQRSADSESS